jgi:hypothetical protein
VIGALVEPPEQEPGLAGSAAAQTPQPRPNPWRLQFLPNLRVQGFDRYRSRYYGREISSAGLARFWQKHRPRPPRLQRREANGLPSVSGLSTRVVAGRVVQGPCLAWAVGMPSKRVLLPPVCGLAQGLFSGVCCFELLPRASHNLRIHPLLRRFRTGETSLNCSPIVRGPNLPTFSPWQRHIAVDRTRPMEATLDDSSPGFAVSTLHNSLCQWSLMPRR